MPSATNTVTVQRPIDEVFQFLADGTNNPRWRPGVLDISPPAGGPAVGAVYAQGMKGPRGKRIAGDYRITELSPSTRIAFEVVAGPARPTGSFELSEPAPGATTVRFGLDLKPRGPMRLMSGMIARSMAEEVACLANLKEALER
ncbi:MAG TPA: SRPBCC family protein [Actinomycetota bacterium]|nr:SRPBCC family protein [Actinomycetota bacterium]